MNRRDRLRLEERRRESMASYQDHDQYQDNSKTLMDSFFQSQQVIQSLSSKSISGENNGSKSAVISKSFRIPRKQNQSEKKDDQPDCRRSIYEPEEELPPNNTNQNGRWSRVKPSARAERSVPPPRSGPLPQKESPRNETFPRKQNQPEKKEDQLECRNVYEPEEKLLPNNTNQNGKLLRVQPSARVERSVPPPRSETLLQKESSRNETFPQKQNQPEKRDDQLECRGSVLEQEKKLLPNTNQNCRWSRVKPSARVERSVPSLRSGLPPQEESALKWHPPQEKSLPPKEPSPQREPPLRRDFSPHWQRTAFPKNRTPSRSWPSRGERSYQMEPHSRKEYDQYISEKGPLPKENLTRRQYRSRERFRNHLAKKFQIRKDRLRSIGEPSTGQEGDQVKNDMGEDGSKIKKIKLDEDDDEDEEEGFFERIQTSDAERAAAINNTPIQMVIYDRSHPDGKIDPKNVKTLHDWFNHIIKEELLSGTGIIPQYLSHGYKDGVFVIMSTNSSSAELLKGKMEHMSALWEGGKLECVYEPYEERIAVVTVPRSIIHPTCFFDMCKESNPKLSTENWRLIAFEGNDIEGKTFTLAIDVNSFKSIRATKGFVRCRDWKVEFILERN